MKRIPVIVALIFGAGSTGAALAQTPSPSSHEQAAIELLEAMDMESQMLGGAVAMTNVMIDQNPTLLPYRDVLLDWAGSILTWELFGPPMVEMYTEAFLESELREMTAFYRTPVGQKVLALQPELANRAMLLSSRESQMHLGELQEMIQRRALELDSRQTEEFDAE